MKKICFIIGNINNTGGTERVTSLIGSKLSEAGYNIYILSLSMGGNPYFDLHPNIKIYSLYNKKVSFKKNFLKTIIKLRKFITSRDFDTIIVVDSIACLFTIPALFKVKNLNHVCWEHFNYKTNMGMKSRTIARNLAARYCNTVVTLTERDKMYWLKSTTSNARILSIPNPTPFPPQDNLNRVSTKTVLAVGRLTYQKGFDLLLKAWVQVNKNHPDWILNIVGEGEDKQHLSEFIKANKLESSVNLLGNKSSISDYYATSDIFCLSSRFEGFPMVLLETLSFGLPVVSFDCDTGPAEILEDTGSILVPSEDVDCLASAIIQMINQERNLIEIKSREKSLIYQPDVILNSWISLIENSND